MRTYERIIWWWVKEKKKMALVFIAITMMLQFQMKACEGCVETERIGLLQLKSYLNSLLSPIEEYHKGSILKSWSPDDRKSDCCDWERVKCSDATGGRVVDLSLNQVLLDIYWDTDAPSLPLNLSLLHSFPQPKTLELSWNGFTDLFDPINGHKSFQKLEELMTLDFSINRLNNSILPFLSAARSLRTLNLGNNNNLEGVFPPNELANMKKLRVLNLESNEFSFFSIQGLINFPELEVLNLRGNIIKDSEDGIGLRRTKLKTLDLSYNSLSQFKGLQHLVELQVLSLANNKFNHSGIIQVLKDMPKLQELDLSESDFTELDSLGLVFPSSLQVLSLKENQLSWTTKGYSAICRLMYLRELDLSRNSLTSMPCCLANLSRLRTLDLSDNQLSGNMFSFVYGLPSALEYLSLLDNNFNGSFCFNSLVNHTGVTVFKLSSKVGTIQDVTESSWVPLFQLKMLKLQNFILGSTIPGFLLHQHDLSFIDLSYNNLKGAFPSWLVQNNTKLQSLLLNSNSLKKLQLPKLVHGLQAFDISSNKIFESIQEDVGIVFPKLRYMTFSSNHFHGTIPSSMGEMKSL